MKQKEIMEQFAPKKVNNQIEFDTFMHEVNNVQAGLNHPYLDRIRELNKQRTLIETQKQALNLQLNAIKVERLEIEQKQKEINRVFHDIKHKMIELNPKNSAQDETATC